MTKFPFFLSDCNRKDEEYLFIIRNIKRRIKKERKRDRFVGIFICLLPYLCVLRGVFWLFKSDKGEIKKEEMFESLIKSILDKVAGEYIQGLNKDNLSIGIFSGDVKIENVSLNP